MTVVEFLDARPTIISRSTWWDFIGIVTGTMLIVLWLHQGTDYPLYAAMFFVALHAYVSVEILDRDQSDPVTPTILAYRSLVAVDAWNPSGSKESHEPSFTNDQDGVRERPEDRAAV